MQVCVAQWERACLQCRSRRRLRFSPWVGKVSWRLAWQPTPVFLPGESHGQRSLEGYSPQSTGLQRAGHDWSDSAHTCKVFAYKHTIAYGILFFLFLFYTVNVPIFSSCHQTKNAWASLRIFTTGHILTFFKWLSWYVFILWQNFLNSSSGVKISRLLLVPDAASLEKFKIYTSRFFSLWSQCKNFLQMKMWANPDEFPDSVYQGLLLSFASFVRLLLPSEVDLGHRASYGLEDPQLTSQEGWQDLQATICYFFLISPMM